VLLGGLSSATSITKEVCTVAVGSPHTTYILDVQATSKSYTSVSDLFSLTAILDQQSRRHGMNQVIKNQE